jgi:rare lipoprotein A
MTGFVLIAASLGGCAQTSVVSQRAGHFAPSRDASLEPRHEARPAHRPVSVVRLREPEHSEPTKRIALATPGGSHGLASFYSEGQETASGERFDPHELTAAHPTLPFGTLLQVTNIATGKSVTVRVNDRGPFVKGRVVDVSYSAAQALGMVHSGVANVKVDVVQ